MSEHDDDDQWVQPYGTALRHAKTGRTIGQYLRDEVHAQLDEHREKLDDLIRSRVKEEVAHVEKRLGRPPGSSAKDQPDRLCLAAACWLERLGVVDDAKKALPALARAYEEAQDPDHRFETHRRRLRKKLPKFKDSRGKKN